MHGAAILTERRSFLKNQGKQTMALLHLQPRAFQRRCHHPTLDYKPTKRSSLDGSATLDRTVTFSQKKRHEKFKMAAQSGVKIAFDPASLHQFKNVVN